MKTFLKAILLLLIAILALKLLPLAFGLGCLLAFGLLGLIAFGVSAVGAIFGGVVFLAAILAPIWVPGLVIVGLIALLKRVDGRSAPAG